MVLRWIPATLLALSLPFESRAETHRLTFDEALRVLTERNAAIASARAAVGRDKAQIAIAHEWPNPTLQYQQDHISLGQQYAGSSPNNISSQRFFIDNVVTLGLSWLWEIGKRGPRQESAKHLAASTAASLKDVLRGKRNDLATSFNASLQADDELRFAHETLASQQETLRLMEARLKAGAIPESDVIRMKLDLRTTENDVLQMELAVKNARSSLKQLLGFGRNDEVIPVGQLLDERLISAAPPPLPRLLDRAMARRPDLAVLQEQGFQQAAQVRLAQAQKIPDLTVSLGYMRDPPNSYVWYGVSLPIPVFNRFRGEELQARSEARRIAADLVGARQKISADVRQALWQFETSQALVRRYRTAFLNHAKESQEIAKLAYMRGATSIMEYLDAQRTFVAVRREFIQNLGALRTGAAALNAAVGERVLY